MTESFGKPKAYFFSCIVNILLLHNIFLRYIILRFGIWYNILSLSYLFPVDGKPPQNPPAKILKYFFAETRTFLKLFFILTVQTKLQKNTFNKRR